MVLTFRASTGEHQLQHVPRKLRFQGYVDYIFSIIIIIVTKAVMPISANWNTNQESIISENSLECKYTSCVKLK